MEVESLASLFVGSRVKLCLDTLCCLSSGRPADYRIELKQMNLGKGIPDEFEKSRTVSSLDLFFWK